MNQKFSKIRKYRKINNLIKQLERFKESYRKEFLEEMELQNIDCLSDEFGVITKSLIEKNMFDQKRFAEENQLMFQQYQYKKTEIRLNIKDPQC